MTKDEYIKQQITSLVSFLEESRLEKEQIADLLAKANKDDQAIAVKNQSFYMMKAIHYLNLIKYYNL